MSFETSALVLAWIAIALLGLAMSGLLRQLHSLAAVALPARVSIGPPTGDPAPALSGLTAWGPNTSVLFLVDADCSVCSKMLPRVAQFANAHSDIDFISVFADGELPSGLDGSRVRIYMDQKEAFDRYRVPVTPFAVVVGKDGIVQDAAPVGSDDVLEAFISRAAGGTHEADTVRNTFYQCPRR